MGLSFAQKAKLTISFIWPIVSIVLAAITYAKWAGSLDYFNGIVNNWENGPVVDIDFRSSCADSGSFAEIDDRRPLKWSLEWCDCRDDTHFKKIIEKKCGEQAGTDPRSSNCTRSIQSQPSIDLPLWRAGLRVCLRRLSVDYAATKRKTSCKDGEVKCADGTCFPVNSCPITDIRSATNRDALPADFEKRNMSNVWFGFKRALDAGEIASSDAPDKLRGVVDIRQASDDDTAGDANWQKLDQTSLLSLVQSNKMANGKTVYQHLQEKEWDGLATAGSQPWFISTRAEIKWNDELCGSKQEFVNTSDPIKNVNRANIALLVITILSSLAGMLGAVMIYRDLSDDDPSNDGHNAARFEKISVAFGCVDLLPTAIVTYYGFRYRSYFEKISNDSCTDAHTAENIAVLTKNLRAVGSVMIVKVVGSTLYLLYRIYRIWRPLPDPKKREDFDKIKAETGNNGGAAVVSVVSPSAPQEESVSTIALQPVSPVAQQQLMMQQPMQPMQPMQMQMQQPMMQQQQMMQPVGMQQPMMMQQPMGMQMGVNNTAMDQQQQLAFQQQQMLLQQQQMAQMQMQGQMPMNNNMGMQQM